MSIQFIARPTIADVTNINEMVAFLALEIKDLNKRQEVLFEKAMASDCYFTSTNLMHCIEELQEQEIDLVKHMNSVHYQALEQMGENDSVITYSMVA